MSKDMLGGVGPRTLTRRGMLRAGGMAGIVAAGAVLAGCSGGSGSSDAGASASASALASAEGAGYQLVNDGQLTVVYSNGFPPFEFSSEDGAEPEGFDIDLIEAVADKMGLACNILPTQKFDTLVPTIKAGGKADVAISAITINDSRKEEIDFSEPYLNSNLAILALSTSSFASVDDFDKDGIKVAASAGTTGESWAEENLRNATVLPLDDYVSCFTGTSTGLYDGCVADLPVANYLTTNSYQDLKVCAEVATGEQYGIAVSKDEPDLTAAINEALAQLESDGTMDEIKTKWFGTTEGL